MQASAMIACEIDGSRLCFQSLVVLEIVDFCTRTFLPFDASNKRGSQIHEGKGHRCFESCRQM